MKKIDAFATRLNTIGGMLCALAFAASAFAQVPGSLHTTPLPAFASGNGKLTALDLTVNQDRALAMALQPDGKIVLAGHCYVPNRLQFCAMRLDAGGALDNSFDGDGVVSATVDTLILTRLALGMRGDDVVSGIGFAGQASRNSWAAIRAYLISQCGMSVY